jgi:signal transduction histidine kinase
LKELVCVPEAEVFPSEALLDHIPDLIREMAGYLRTPGDEAIAANTAVIAKAQELGVLRHAQRASVHQVLQEYRLLGNILTAFVREETDRLPVGLHPTECIDVIQRLHECVGVLLQTTVDTFIAQYTTSIDQHTRRLESFNRLISHELRQPLGTLQYAVALLRDTDTSDTAKRGRVVGVLDRNVTRLIDLTRTLEALSRVRATADAANLQRVDLVSVASEAARQLREMADARLVDVRVGPNLPVLALDVSRIELVFINLLSNAIKYSDPSKGERFVEIIAGDAPNPGECTILVRDNGLGIAAESVNAVFTQFFRAHADRDDELGIEGAGLGLSIVADCVQALGGRITVESTLGTGTTFRLVLPANDAIPG